MTSTARTLQADATRQVVRNKRELKIRIAPGPCCPHCGEDGFDDWHREPTLRFLSGSLSGRLKCHGCSKFFSVTHYFDGETHSTAWRKMSADVARVERERVA